jgi:hypothetical protein
VSHEEFMELLRQRVKEEGGPYRFAANHDMSQGYVCVVLDGRDKPGPKMALALGMRIVRTYEPIKKK